MKNYLIAKNKAIRHMKIADHVLTMTYPLVQDPKLLKLVLRNMFLSLKHAMIALADYDNIEVYNEDSFSELLQTITPCLVKYKISRDYINFLNELNALMKKQTESGVEFIRKDKFIFARDDYKLSAVTKKEMRDYLTKSKLFVQTVLGVIK